MKISLCVLHYLELIKKGVKFMTQKDIMNKYSISDEELLHIRAMFNGTTIHCDREHIEQMHMWNLFLIKHITVQ